MTMKLLFKNHDGWLAGEREDVTWFDCCKFYRCFQRVQYPLSYYLHFILFIWSIIIIYKFMLFIYPERRICSRCHQCWHLLYLNILLFLEQTAGDRKVKSSHHTSLVQLTQHLSPGEEGCLIPGGAGSTSDGRLVTATWWKKPGEL